MKINITVLLLVALFCGCLSKRTSTSAQPGPDPNFHLYLLVGQSNMAGRGEIDSASQVIDSAIFALDSMGHWVHALDPIHFDKPSAGVGPGISFAKSLLANHDTTIRIGLIPCAVGGTSINSWFPGRQDPVTKVYPYDHAIRRAILAMKAGVLKGVLWHQGGSDNTPEKAIGYLDKQLDVIQNFRQALGAELPFVLGEQGYFKDTQLINKIIQGVPNQLPQVAVVSAAGLTEIGDGLHFDTPSARLLGERYAVAMQSLLTTQTGHEH